MTLSPQTSVESRPIQGDEDARRVREFLVDAHRISPPDFNWEVRRWDGWRFYNPSPEWNPAWESQVQIWETADSRVVGAVLGEGGRAAHLQVHPHYRSLVEEQLVVWAEEHVPTVSDEGTRSLAIIVYEYDRHRQLLLDSRGYEKTDGGAIFYLLRLGSQTMPERRLPDGYRLRATRPGDVDDAQKIADLLNAAFRRDFHNADEYLVFAGHAPCFRNDLDLVVEAPDGSFASYVGLPYDEVNGYAIFEPVCTHPNHERLGLAQAAMWEALRRAQDLGAATASVATGRKAEANRLYESIGFTETYESRVWRWTKRP